MDLFVVNRFMGEEHPHGTTPSQSILDQLHQKAKKRKLRKSLPDTNLNVNINDESYKGRCKKKKELHQKFEEQKGEEEENGSKVIGDSATSDVNVNVELHQEKHSKKDKKKKIIKVENENEFERSEIVAEENGIEVEPNECEEEARSKRKKEKRKRKDSLKMIEDDEAKDFTVAHNQSYSIKKEENRKQSRKEDGLNGIEASFIEEGLDEEIIPHKKKKKKSKGGDKNVVKDLRQDLASQAESEPVNGEDEDKKWEKKSKKGQDSLDSDVEGIKMEDGAENDGGDTPQTPVTSEKRKKKKKKDKCNNEVTNKDGDESVSKEEDGVQSETTDNLDSKESNKDAMFPVLGGFGHSRKEKVKRVLPEWLANPSLISSDIVKSSVDVTAINGLDQRIIDALNEMNIHKFFPVQYKVIPLVLQSVCHGIHIGPAGYRPRDICISAPTGSGKTLAFVVPIVQSLLDRGVQRFRALVVLPTKDLATQVYKVFHSLCQGTPLQVIMIGGLRTIQKEQGLLVKQSYNGEYQCGGDILVATPGRLIDHINSTKGFTLKYLRFLVVDEADRMMDQLSKDWITRVEKAVFTDDRPLPGPITIESESRMNMPLQKLLFSATLSQNPESLMHLNLFQPRLVTSVMSHDQPMVNGSSSDTKTDFIGKYTTPTSLEEYYVVCSSGEKPLILVHMLKSLNFTQVLCFTNSVESTHRLYLLLELIGGINVAEFSSKLSGTQRQSIIKKFKNDHIKLLICSDAMARGMDLSNVKYVVSYDMPPFLKTYIHRVGRTARAGRKGVAYTILQHQEETKFKSLMKAADKKTVQKIDVTSNQLGVFVEEYEKALKKLPVSLKGEVFLQRNR